MAKESSDPPKGVFEDAVPSYDDSGEVGHVEGVNEIESLCMNCHDDVCSTY
jgi:hypothetical protein